jgi:hypothetical protein
MLVKLSSQEQLWSDLRARLFDSVNNRANLTCAGQNNTIVNCRQGFCLLLTRGGDRFISKCINQDTNSTRDPSGIEIYSNTVTRPEEDATFTYVCNKPMCNSRNMANEVQQLFR